jgi:hypothetical protein
VAATTRSFALPIGPRAVKVATEGGHDGAAPPAAMSGCFRSWRPGLASRRFPEPPAYGAIDVAEKRGQLVSLVFQTIERFSRHEGDGLQNRLGGAERVK